MGNSLDDWQAATRQAVRSQRLQSFRLRLSFGGGLRGWARGNRQTGNLRGKGAVLVRGSYRYLKGRNAKSNANVRHRDHLRYLAGERVDQIAKGVDKDRKLFDEHGQQIGANEASTSNRDFIEHRLIVSPGGSALADEDLHMHAQHMLERIRERNPEAEVRANYAIHRDTGHPHLHLNITSPNHLKLTKADYQSLRRDVSELRNDLEQGNAKKSPTNSK